MARKKYVYFKNISEYPQEFRHRLLAGVPALPVAPGGFIDCPGTKAVLAAEAICQVPALVWSLSPGVAKRRWAKEVEHTDYRAALDKERQDLLKTLEAKLRPRLTKQIRKELTTKPEDLPPESVVPTGPAEAEPPDAPTEPAQPKAKRKKKRKKKRIKKATEGD